MPVAVVAAARAALVVGLSSWADEKGIYFIRVEALASREVLFLFPRPRISAGGSAAIA